MLCFRISGLCWISVWQNPRGILFAVFQGFGFGFSFSFSSEGLRIDRSVRGNGFISVSVGMWTYGIILVLQEHSAVECSVRWRVSQSVSGTAYKLDYGTKMVTRRGDVPLPAFLFILLSGCVYTVKAWYRHQIENLSEVNMPYASSCPAITLPAYILKTVWMACHPSMSPLQGVAVFATKARHRPRLCMQMHTCRCNLSDVCMRHDVDMQ
jgi:hypothetical protein